MNTQTISNFVKQELSGWKPFEVIWLVA
ncbi:nicotinamide riboside transporter PnuC, partial [Xanthomonas citri pv. citri]|nr:nicotinamide riboside transporter PnuC [Xanthomonas citri pv. citri]